MVGRLGNMWVVLEIPKHYESFDKNCSSTTWEGGREDDTICGIWKTQPVWQSCSFCFVWQLESSDQNHHPHSQKSILTCFYNWSSTLDHDTFILHCLIYHHHIYHHNDHNLCDDHDHSGHHLWLDNVLKTSFPLAANRSTCRSIWWF